LVIQAYREVDTDWPLVVVGGNTYKPSYVRELQALADDRVRFTGPVYGDTYWSLQQNAGLFVFAGEIGGVHPALVEAMAAGNAILYLDTPANRETVCGTGIPFQPTAVDLSARMARLISSPKEVSRLGSQAFEAARNTHSWEKITDQYEQLFFSMLDNV
jgi:glycosyltransferase involved in cell wall biosynthesis